MRLIRGITVIALALSLGACADRGLRELSKPSEGPDEFIIVPTKPLEQPGNFAELPAPTPGGANITDQNPLQDSVAALGGRRSAAGASIPARDGALVNHVSRFGRSTAIREQLAQEDEDFRKRRGRFTGLRFRGVDRYVDVYRRQTLDPAREQARWRRAGARTPSAPPAF